MKVPAILLISLFFLPSFMHAQEGVTLPGTVDLLWQGKVYTPPFYPGRALWSNQSQVLITAIPQTSGNASSLIYKWSKDGSFLGAVSGTGQRTLTFADSILSKSTVVKVEVLSPDGLQTLATQSVTLTPKTSEVVVVENNPLYGLMLNSAIDKNFVLNEDEVSFTALPLFADLEQRASSEATYSWATSAGDSRAGNTVTYRIPDGASGTSEVTLKMTNSKTLAKPGAKTFRVQFGTKAEL